VGQLLALTDYLQMSALDQKQTEIVGALQDGLLSIAIQGEPQIEGDDGKPMDGNKMAEGWKGAFY
jgi:hypothetical protein